MIGGEQLSSEDINFVAPTTGPEVHEQELPEWTRQNIDILKSIATNGLLAPSERKGESSLSSATSSEQTGTLTGVVIEPPAIGEYDPEHDEYLFKGPISGMVKERVQSPKITHGFLEPRSFDRYYQSYLNGEDTPAAQGAKKAAEGYSKALYETTSSVFPVMTERPWIKPETQFNPGGNEAYRNLRQGDCEQSMANSILVVTKLGKVLEGPGQSTHQLTALGGEVKAVGQVPISEVERIIVPENMRAVVEQAFPEELIRERCQFVGSVEKNISTMKWNDAPMEVPDYESALRQIVEEAPDAYWIHGVRLKLPNDIAIEGQIQDSQELQQGYTQGSSS